MNGTISITVFVAAVGLYVGLAAVSDLRVRRIPNWLTVPAALLGLAYHAFSPTGWGLGVSLAGLAVGFALLFVPWLAGGGGMGDVKLLAALGAWLGTQWLLIAFAVSAFFGCLLMIVLLFRGAAKQGIARTGRRFLGVGRTSGKSPKARRPRILPFAVPVAMSTWTLLAWMVIRGGI